MPVNHIRRPARPGPPVSDAAAPVSRRRFRSIAAALLLLVACGGVIAAVTAGRSSDEQALETGRIEDHGGKENADAVDPRPSGNDRRRPAGTDEDVVFTGPEAVDVPESPRLDPAARTDRWAPTRSVGGGRSVQSTGTQQVGEDRGGSGRPTTTPGHPDPPHDHQPQDSGPGTRGPGEGSVESTPIEDAPPDHEPSRQPVVDPIDVVRCPLNDLHPIGHVPEDADAELSAFGPRFRAMAGAELARDVLVCATPVERWRDLVIQRLYVGGQPDGTLTASADGDGSVVRFTYPEWKGYRLVGEGDFPFNLSGRPMERVDHGDHSIVRTTRGGLVSRRPDTHGFLVINGAWSTWADQGGRAHMGFPETQPALSPTLDIYQDFAHGWLQLPGIQNPFVAETLPPEAYVWHPITDPAADVPPDARGNILEVNETSWFVDLDGVRHWIPDSREFNCARAEHGARKITVRGWVVATFPIGEAYTCPSDRSTG